MSTLLQMVDPLPPVALAHFLSDQPRHHAPDPLLPDDGVLCALERSVVLVIDPIKGWRNLGLFGQEEFGLWCRHCGGGSGRSELGVCLWFPRTPSSDEQSCDGAIGGVARCGSRDVVSFERPELRLAAGARDEASPAAPFLSAQCLHLEQVQRNLHLNMVKTIL